MLDFSTQLNKLDEFYLWPWHKHYLFWLRVHGLRYAACNAHASFYIAICGLSGSVPNFSTLSHKRHDFRKKRELRNLKRVFWFSLQICLKQFLFLEETSRGIRRCPGWPMAKPDINFVYYVTKKEGRNKLWKCFRVKYAPCYVRKSPVLTQKYTRARKDSIVNECNVFFYN
jgi:hypothetical protein